GVQLDEVAFPILLAGRLEREKALGGFDPYPMVLKAARFLVARGPATHQERWEEVSGYSPSTLAVTIAACSVASEFARGRGDASTAEFLRAYADFLECHLERWPATTEGTLVPGIPRHYLRIPPVDLADPHPDEDANHGIVTLPNQPPGSPTQFPATGLVDAGFLELVRYGIRTADDPIVVDSVRVVDRILRVD